MGDRVHLIGMALYALSTLLASCSLVLSKFLSGATGQEVPMPVLQLVFVRSCMLVVCTLPAVRHPAARQLIAQRPQLWLMRGVLGFASIAFIQQAVHLLAISDAMALALLSPLVVATLGTLVLHERPPQLLLLALPLGTAGALLLVKPGVLASLAGNGHGTPKSSIKTSATLGPAALGVAAGLGHVFSSAGAKLSVRRMAAGSTSRHAAAMIVLSAGLLSAVGSAAICAWQQTALVWPQHALGWVLLEGLGIMSFGHQACMTAAMQRVPATRAAPLAYLSAVWGILADFLVFGHSPSTTSLVGGTAIVVGGLLVTWRRQHDGSGSSPLKTSSLRSGNSAGEVLQRLVPVQVDTNTGASVLLPLATNSAGYWQEQRPVTAGLLKAALASAWMPAWVHQQPITPPLTSFKLPSPPALHIKDENAMSAAAISTAVRKV